MTIIAPANWEELRKFVEQDDLPASRRSARVDTELLGEADMLYASIDEEIGTEPDGLYKCGTAGADGQTTKANASMGIFACLLGRMEEAEKRYALICEKIGRNSSGLYKQGPNAVSFVEPTDDNALVGVLACLLDRKEDAETLYASINRKNKSGRVYKPNADNPFIYTSSNAAMGILAFKLGKKREAGGLFDFCRSILKGKDGLYPFIHEGSDAFTYDNALVGMLAFLLGEEDEAAELYNSVNRQIGKGQTGLYKAGHGDSNAYTHSNAMMGMLACLLAGVEMKQ